MPRTSGLTSVLPKSTDVFVYTGWSPPAGTAYCMKDFTAALDDGETPYPSPATFVAPNAFISFDVSVVWIPEMGGEFPKAQNNISLCRCAHVVRLISQPPTV